MRTAICFCLGWIVATNAALPEPGRWPTRDDHRRPRPQSPAPPPHHHEAGPPARPHYPTPPPPLPLVPICPPVYVRPVVVPFAEAVLTAARPDLVRAELGALDGCFAPLGLRFDDGVDVVRASGGPGPIVCLPRTVTVRVDLGGHAPWLDGRREWYLRLTDGGALGPVLESFRVVTAGGERRIRQVPTRIPPGRPLEARLTPAPHGYACWPVEPLPNLQGDPYDPAPSSSFALRRLPETVWPGQPVTIELCLRLPAVRWGRLTVVENLPPGWRINRLDPAGGGSDGSPNRAVWRFDNPPGELRLRIEAVAPPTGSGWQFFSGTWRLDDDPPSNLGGDRQCWLGSNRPQWP
jgi:hypothetical protein